MSVSELFDRGAPHPWADLRVNTLTVDGPLIVNGDVITSPISLSGPFPATGFNILFAKVGRIVVMTLPDLQSAAGGGTNLTPITSAIGALDLNFVPDFPVGENELFWPIRVINAGVLQASPGMIRIENNGRFTIFSSQGGGTFSNAAALTGAYATTIAYRSAT